LYLTTVLDLYDRKIIGWSLSSGMSVTSLAAWRMAIKTEASQRDCYFILTEVFNTPVKNLQTWLILIKSLPEVVEKGTVGTMQ
jgi:hypothetical protein